MTNLPQATGDAAPNVRGPVSRRALVAGLAGAVGAAAAATVGTAAPAEAASPPVLLSQDNTGPNAHRTAIFVPNATEVASLGDSGSTFHNVFLGVYGTGATAGVRGDGALPGAMGVQGNGAGDAVGVYGTGGPDGGSGVLGQGSLTEAAWPVSAARTASPAGPVCPELAAPLTVSASPALATVPAPGCSAAATGPAPACSGSAAPRAPGCKGRRGRAQASAAGPWTRVGSGPGRELRRRHRAAGQRPRRVHPRRNRRDLLPQQVGNGDDPGRTLHQCTGPRHGAEQPWGVRRRSSSEHQHRHSQAHPEQGSRHRQRPPDRRRGLVRGELTPPAEPPHTNSG